MNNRERLTRVGAAVGLVVGGAAIGYEWHAHQNPKPTPIIRTADGLVPASTEGTVIPAATATVIAASKAEATNTPEIVSTMELPKPVGWDHAPVVSLMKAVNVPSFPKTREEAAKTFGVDEETRNPERWEPTAEGKGWHYSEGQDRPGQSKNAKKINSGGYLAEIYFDTKLGRNPYAYVIVGIGSDVPAQGATVWDVQGVDQAAELQREMAIPMWKDDNGNVAAHPVTIIVPNQEQKAKAESTGGGG